MKYLIDNQLPSGLVRHLGTHALEATHVGEVGLAQGTDRDLWQFAAANGYAVISKDEDFLHLSVADPNGPPFIWVRLGNCRNAALFAAFDRVLPQLLAALAAG